MLCPPWAGVTVLLAAPTPLGLGTCLLVAGNEMASPKAYLWLTGFKASSLPPGLSKSNCFLHTFISKQMPSAPLHEQNLHSIPNTTQSFKNAIYSKKASTGTPLLSLSCFSTAVGPYVESQLFHKKLNLIFSSQSLAMLHSCRRKGSWGSLGTNRVREAAGWLHASARCVEMGSDSDAAVLHGLDNGIVCLCTGRFSTTLWWRQEERSSRRETWGKEDWNKEPVVKSETAEKSRIVPDGLFLNWLTRAWCVVWVRILCQLKNWDSHGTWRTVQISIFFLLLMYSDQTPNEHHCSPAAARNPEHWAWEDRYWSFCCSDFPAAWWLNTSWRPGPFL